VFVCDSTKFDLPSDTHMYANDITINPKKFSIKEKNFLEHTNSKWFINLSNTTIPQEVSTLLQFGDRFCLPMQSNKKFAIIFSVSSVSFFNSML